MQIHRPAIADRKVRFAVIGCGRIAQNHFEAIKQHVEPMRADRRLRHRPGGADRAQ